MRGVYKHGWMDVLYDTVSSMKKYRKNTQMDVYIITPFQNSSCSSSILPSHQLIRPNQKSLIINSRTLVFRACIFIDNKVWMLRKRRVYVPRLYVKTINVLSCTSEKAVKTVSACSRSTIHAEELGTHTPFHERQAEQKSLLLPNYRIVGERIIRFEV